VATGLPAPRAGFVEWWRSLGRVGRVTLSVVAVAIAYQIASSVVAGVTGSGSTTKGPASSLDTSPSGAAGYAALLTARGFDVQRLTSPLAGASLGPGVLVVLEPADWTLGDAREVARQVRSGRTVVVAGRESTSALRQLTGSSPSWGSEPIGRAHVATASQFTAGVAEVASPGDGSYPSAGGSTPMLAGDTGLLATTASDGGTLVALASASPLTNASLALSDNAALAINLARSPSRTVIFDEFAHGVGARGSGLAGLPAPWRYGLGLGLLAVGLWVLSAMARLGPPRRRRRAGIPPRAAYVDAMATALDQRPLDQRLRASTPVLDDLREGLGRRLGLAPGAGPEDIAAAASRLPGGHQDLMALAAVAVSDPRDERDMIAVGDAHAALREISRGGTR
jgi:hypothetical protein